MSTISGREAYGRTLLKIGKDERVVVLDADVSKATKTSYFAEKYPERFFNVGVAEQNLMGVASGFAITGKIPVVSTFAVFAAGRAFDQVRNTICNSNLNVKIVATHAGITVGQDGSSHQSIEDIALMRSIPGMVVISPADSNETGNALEEVIMDYKGPAYIRLSRHSTPDITDEKDKFEIGKAKIIRKGGDITIISTGILLNNCLKASDILEEKGIKTSVLNMSTIKPLDKENILKFTKNVKGIITVEEHSRIGGLYSAVTEFLSGRCPGMIKSISINDRFGISGNPEELLKIFKLTEYDIVEETCKILGIESSYGVSKV